MTAILPRPGPVGPPGSAGPAGPPGPPGPGSGDLTYLHLQLVPAAVWTINHGLGKEPAVTVIDSGDTEVEGDVVFPTLNQVILTFSAPFGGRARLN